MRISEDTRKNKTVLAALRRWIAKNGQPGSRLPTRHELAHQHGVSLMTAQRAFDTLASDGFVVSRGRNGTFVVAQPPHLFRYGVVFPSDPSGGETGFWPPFWHALHQEAMRVALVDRRRTVVPFYNVTGHHDSEDFQALLREVESSRLAGLIFAGQDLLAAAALEKSDVPCVVMGDGPFPNAFSIGSAGWSDCIEPALKSFSANGRKRIAVIDIPGSSLIDPIRQLAAIQKLGMESHPYWLLPIDHKSNSAANPIVQLLMSGRPDERPDGLFIANPFLVEPATAGLVAAGVRIPQELEVIAGGNFPHLTRSHVPVRWLGVDVREMVRIAIDLIDRKRRGETVEQVTNMPNIFEEQISSDDPLKRLVEI